MTADNLEAAVRATWSDDELAVYADHLLSVGDVRGELIAIDLSSRPRDKQFNIARRAIVDRWIGKPLANKIKEQLRYGVAFSAGDSLRVLNSAAGPYVRRVSGFEGAEAILPILAAEPRPWLEMLRLEKFAKKADRPIDQASLDQLIEQTPNLVELELEAPRSAARFEHPNVRIVHLRPSAVLDGVMPAVEEIRLRLVEGDAARLAPEMFPRLRCVDLRVNYGFAREAILEFMAHPISWVVGEVRLPVMGNSSAVDAARALVDGRPNITRLRVTRDSIAQVDREGTRPVDDYPFLREDITERMLAIRIAGAGELLLDLYDVVSFLKNQFDDAFTDEGRAAWTALFGPMPAKLGALRAAIAAARAIPIVPRDMITEVPHAIRAMWRGVHDRLHTLAALSDDTDVDVRQTG